MRATITLGEDARDLTRRALRAIYYAFLVTGIMAIAYSSCAVMYRYFYQGVQTSKFERVVASPGPRVIEPAAIADGGVIGEIEVPRLGLKAIVVQGDSERLLRRAVGHLPETALPGQAGNIALAGHRDGLFRPLRNVRSGDTITLRTQDREFQYQVEWTAIVSPTAVQMIQPTIEPSLTLVTCYPFYYFGAAPKRFIVRARKIAIPEQTPSAP